MPFLQKATRRNLGILGIFSEQMIIFKSERTFKIKKIVQFFSKKTTKFEIASYLIKIRSRQKFKNTKKCSISDFLTRDQKCMLGHILYLFYLIILKLKKYNKHNNN